MHGSMAGLFIALPVLGVNALFEGKGWKYILVFVGNECQRIIQRVPLFTPLSKKTYFYFIFLSLLKKILL